jgi:hypothetical protein
MAPKIINRRYEAYQQSSSSTFAAASAASTTSTTTTSSSTLSLTMLLTMLLKELLVWLIWLVSKLNSLLVASLLKHTTLQSSAVTDDVMAVARKYVSNNPILFHELVHHCMCTSSTSSTSSNAYQLMTHSKQNKALSSCIISYIHLLKRLISSYNKSAAKEYKIVSSMVTTTNAFKGNLSQRVTITRLLKELSELVRGDACDARDARYARDDKGLKSLKELKEYSENVIVALTTKLPHASYTKQTAILQAIVAQTRILNDFVQDKQLDVIQRTLCHELEDALAEDDYNRLRRIWGWLGDRIHEHDTRGDARGDAKDDAVVKEGNEERVNSAATNDASRTTNREIYEADGRISPSSSLRFKKLRELVNSPASTIVYRGTGKYVPDQYKSYDNSNAGKVVVRRPGIGFVKDLKFVLDKRKIGEDVEFVGDYGDTNVKKDGDEEKEEEVEMNGKANVLCQGLLDELKEFKGGESLVLE